MPAPSIAPPSIPAGPTAASRAMPATAGGSTSGSSTSVTTTALPGKERVASRYAAGVPTQRMIAIEMAVVRSESQRASSAPGSPRLSISSEGLESRKMATTGTVRKVSAAASDRASSTGNQNVRR